jgi:hypothetical protein
MLMIWPISAACHCQKNDGKIIYFNKGINMVCMFILKKRLNNRPPSSATSHLLCYRPRPITTLPLPPSQPISTPAVEAAPWHQWEKGSSPKKNSSPHLQSISIMPSLSLMHIVAFTRYITWDSIHWLCLCHKFLNVYTSHPTHYPSNDQKNTTFDHFSTNTTDVFFHNVPMALDSALLAFHEMDTSLTPMTSDHQSPHPSVKCDRNTHWPSPSLSGPSSKTISSHTQELHPSDTSPLNLCGGATSDIYYHSGTPPSLPFSTDTSNGSTLSESDNKYQSNTHPQPNDTICNININTNNNTTNKSTHMKSSICSQNAWGLWCHPRNPAGNIIINAHPDFSKLDYIVNMMQQHDSSAWLL